MVLPALGLLAVLAARDDLAFGQVGLGNTALLISAGLVTAVPLLFFASAARQVSLSTLGLLQYLAPTLQLIFGLTIFDESMSPVRLAGFCLVWLALLIFSVDGLRARTPVPVPEQPIPDEALHDLRLQPDPLTSAPRRTRRAAASPCSHRIVSVRVLLAHRGRQSQQCDSSFDLLVCDRSA